MTNHWTQESAKDFAYHLSLDFFTQLQDRFEQLEMQRSEFADKLKLSAGRISQILNNPPDNPKLESLVKYAQAMGMKVAVVAYDDGDPSNEKGPIFSEVFSRCWEREAKPRDLADFVETGIAAHQFVAPPQIVNQSFYRPEVLTAPSVRYVIEEHPANSVPIEVLIVSKIGRDAYVQH